MGHYLVTGAAGFIGARTAEMLIARGDAVTGVDNLNDMYDVRMKAYRLERLQSMPGFVFHKLDIADKEAVFLTLNGENDGFDNLGAWAGVRPGWGNTWAFA